MTKSVKYWLDLSDYDLATAEAMLLTKRYLYVGFMCHQAIEKILKALYVQLFNELPPYTHNLIQLTNLTNINKELSEEQKEVIIKLMPLNVESRYPKYKEN